VANEEHLAILKQGIEVWTEWREKNPDIIPDLSGANFKYANLSKANLSKANLSKANFRYANLSEANLNKANFRYANLSEANLSKANFRYANLSEANLSETDFWRTNLSEADLSGADLSGADLSEANLSEANLNEQIFSWTILDRAILKEAKFSRADLKETNLSRADLKEANLSRVILNGQDLSGQDLRKANLSEANLSKIQALATNFQGATLTGACIQDWNINSQTNLDDVICDYVYLKANQQERRPHDPTKNFAPGEFTKLFQKALETVDLIFSDGIDWQIFLTSFQQLQIESRDSQLSVQAIEKKPNGTFVIRVEVPDDVDKAVIEASFWQKYKPLLEAKDEQIAFYSQEVKIKREENTRLLGLIETMAEKERISLKEEQIKVLQAINRSLSHERQLAQELNLPIYRVKHYLEVMQKQGYLIYSEGSPLEEAGEPEYSDCRLTNKGKVAAENPSNLIKELTMTENRTINMGSGSYNENRGNVGIGHMSGGEIKEGAKVAGVINEAEKQNLAEAAAEIQQLLKQLEQSYPTEMPPESQEEINVAVRGIAKNPALSQRVIGALKAGGIEALRELTDNAYVNILLAAWEGWQEAE